MKRSVGSKSAANGSANGASEVVISISKSTRLCKQVIAAPFTSEIHCLRYQVHQLDIY